MNLLDDWFAAQDAEIALQRSGVSLAAFRERYGWTRADDITDREVYRGFSTLESGYALTAPAGFRVVESWSDGYRVVWASSSERAILTYCEGDLSLEMCADYATFRASMLAAGRFYGDLSS